MDIDQIDLPSLQRAWARRVQAAAEVRMRTDPRGMTRPARDEEERAYLAGLGKEGVFQEVARPDFAPGERARVSMVAPAAEVVRAYT